MTPPDKSTDKNVSLLEGQETLDLYLKEITKNLATMIGQAGLLRTAISEMEQQLHEQTAMEQPVPHPNGAQSGIEDLARLEIERPERK
jgi:hypothetical protein